MIFKNATFHFNNNEKHYKRGNKFESFKFI